MCPEAGVLSAYLDGELEARWMTSVEEHLRQCGSCAAKFGRMAEMSGRLRTEDDPELVDTMARVRNSLEARAPTRTSRWRAVQVPAPIVALAASLVVLLGAALALATFRPWDTSTVRFTASPTGIRQFEIKGNAEDIRKILDALNKDAVDRRVTLEIPKAFPLAVFGEPELRPAVQRSAR
jgi:anti-sigma factor RsiW